MPKRSKLGSIEKRVKEADTRRAGPVSERTVKGRIADRRKEKILLRELYRCRACGRVGSWEDLEIDHIVPFHLGGGESEWNLQPLCKACHRKKTDQEHKGRAG
jgi:5-methylcytosine-specific restriction enzyme A